MKNIAIIPARSGSKGLKDKNIKLLNDKPLFAYTIEAAQKSNLFVRYLYQRILKNMPELLVNGERMFLF